MKAAESHRYVSSMTELKIDVTPIQP